MIKHCLSKKKKENRFFENSTMALKFIINIIYCFQQFR